MKDLNQFYARLLKIKRPWIVTEVRFSASEERVDIYVDHERGVKLRCPRCNAWCPVYDHSPERQGRHLDTCDVPTYVPTRLPRVRCQEHGVISMASDWAEPGSDLTSAMEAHLIDLEKECPLQAVSRLTGLSWDRCWGMMDRSVRRGQRRKTWKVPTYSGVDEKSFAKRHQYMTLVCDLETRSVEYVADARRQEHKKRRAQQDEVLTGSKYLWLYHPDPIPDNLLPRFEELRRMDLQVSRAWPSRKPCASCGPTAGKDGPVAFSNVGISGRPTAGYRPLSRWRQR